MKKTGLIIPALALALALCACSAADEPQPTQTPPEATEDMTIYDKSEGVLTRELRYNSNGLKFNTVVYEYGEGGLVCETTLGINDAPVGRCEYVRGEGGLVTEKIVYAAEGPEEYSEEYRVLYEYNETGLKMKETNMRGGAAASVTTFAYEGKNLTAEKYFEGTELISEKSYEYDEAGRQTKCVRSDHIEGGTVTDVYAYDGAGRLLSCESSADGAVSGRTEYAYDEHGSVLSVSVFGADGATVSVTKNEYVYDEPGNIVKCTVSQEDGTQTTVTEYVWEYAKG